MMMFGFSNRPATVQPSYEIGGERPAKVYSIGRHTVTVYEDGQVTAHQPSGYHGDPRRSLPNMEIIDGQIRIAMEDLIDEVLARIEPQELAVTLWANDEVKERFMEALSERWTYDNVGDADRRKFLDKVKETIHSAALDRLADKMAKLEYTVSTQWSCYREIAKMNDRLSNLDVRDHDGAPVRLNDPSAFGEFSIGGATWTEARDHWRNEVRERFAFQPDQPNSGE